MEEKGVKDACIDKVQLAKKKKKPESPEISPFPS